MIAAKHFDPIVGVDVHIILIPSPAGPIPTPLPNPYVGMVMDPFDYVPFVGATVKVNGVPRAQAGTGGIALVPHLPLGGPFGPPPPSNESEVFMGSATVAFDGDAQSYLGLPVLSCQSIGMPPPPRAKGAPPKSMVLPTSVVLAIPMGMLVMIGGPPTISLMALGFRVGLGALKKLAQLGPIARRIKGASDAIHAAAERAMKKLGLGDGARNAVHKGICSVTGHPVDIATGKVLTSRVDFEMPGPIPFRWERSWFSTSTYQGPLGHGWHHSYDQALILEEDVVLYRTADGRHVGLPVLAPGGEYFDRREKLTFSRDAAGSHTIRNAQGHVHRFVPVAGRPQQELPLVEIATVLGNRLQLRYDAWGRLAQVVDCAGRVVEVAYDQAGRIAALVAPHSEIAGQRVYVARYAYDGWGNLATVWDALDQPASFAYDRHLLVKETDRNGLSFYFQYDGPDESARCVRTWGDGGIYDHKLSYDLDAKRTVVENSLGFETTYFHDGALVTKVVNALGAASETEYSDYCEIVAETDPLGQRTESKYDDRGNLVEHKTPDGATSEITYGPDDRPVSARDALGGEWTWKYDAYGRLLERTNPVGEKYTFEWRGAELAAVTDPARQRTSLGYDPSGNLISLITPDGSESRWTYDARGRIRSITDPNGNQELLERDAKGRVVRAQLSDGNVRELAYDAEDNVLRARDRQHDVGFGYQGMGRLASRSEAGTTVTFEYDTEEQLTAIRNEHGSVYRFVLDALGNVVEEHGFDGLHRRYERDAAGRIVKLLRPDDRHSSFAYDAAGRVTSIVHSDGTKEQYGYRATGDLALAGNGTLTVQFERDALGRVVKETQGPDWVSSTYDASGLRNSVRSSKGVFQRIRRNVMGDVLAIEASTSAGASESVPGTRADAGGDTASPTHDFVANFARDRLGLEIERSLPGGIQAKWHRDRLGRPLRQDVFRTGRSVTSKQYVWDVNVRLKRVIDAMTGPIEYHHDALGNLAAAVYADGRVELRMPDAVGNLFRTQDRNDRKYGAAGQLLEAHGPRGVTRYEYDSEGNLVRKLEPDGGIWSYEWNGSGMLTRVGRPDGRSVLFAYDALGRRVSKKYRGKETRWVWDGNVPLHEWVQNDPNYSDVEVPNEPAQTEHAAAVVAAAWREAWSVAQPSQGPPATPTSAPDAAAAIADDDPPDSERGTPDAPITWLFEPETFAPLGKLRGRECFGIVTDHLGTPTAMYGSSGDEVWSADVDTYGGLRNLRGNRQACPFRWPGQYEDSETGLYYNRFRYYDPDAGAYIRQDPIGLARGTALYGYVQDALVWTDPYGLHAVRSWFTPPGGPRTPVGNPQMGGENFWPNVPGSGSNGMAPSGLGRLNDSENLLLEHLDATQNQQMKGGVLEIVSVPAHGSSLPPCSLCDEGLQAFADKQQVTVVYSQVGRRGMPVGEPRVYRPRTGCT